MKCELAYQHRVGVSMTRKRFSVRLSINKYKQLNSLAKRHKISMNRAIVDLLSTSDDLPTAKFNQLKSLKFAQINCLNKIYEQLQRIGNNINQISHKLNVNPTINSNHQFDLINANFGSIIEDEIREMKISHDYKANQ